MKQRPRTVEGLAEGFGLWELLLFCGAQGMSFLFLFFREDTGSYSVFQAILDLTL